MLSPVLHLPHEPQFGSAVSISGSFTVATAAHKHLVPTHQPSQWASTHGNELKHLISAHKESLCKSRILSLEVFASHLRAGNAWGWEVTTLPLPLPPRQPSGLVRVRTGSILLQGMQVSSLYAYVQNCKALLRIIPHKRSHTKEVPNKSSSFQQGHEKIKYWLDR